MNQDSALSVATGYGLNDQGVRVQVPVGSRIKVVAGGDSLQKWRVVANNID
jgi:hypothetical protein